MAGRIGAILRLAALCALAALIAACAPVEAPRLGSGPPVLSPKTLKTLSKPAPTRAEVTFSLDPITNAPGDMIYAFQDELKAGAPPASSRLSRPAMPRRTTGSRPICLRSATTAVP